MEGEDFGKINSLYFFQQIYKQKSTKGGGDSSCSLF